MTKEEKQLLLKDLCARLPYGVKLNFYTSAIRENHTCTLLGIEPNDNKSIIVKVDTGAFKFPAEHIKPYLRSMSSMTEEEKYIYRHMLGATLNSEGESIMFVYVEDFSAVIDWLLANHFDFRGLIPMGLALEAPEGMYKTE
jgi:hypothetical protein